MGVFEQSVVILSLSEEDNRGSRVKNKFQMRNLLQLDQELEERG